MVKQAKQQAVIPCLSTLHRPLALTGLSAAAVKVIPYSCRCASHQ